MKIIICGGDVAKDVAGPGAWIRRLAEHLRDFGDEVHVLCYCRDAPENATNYSWLKEQGFDVSGVNMRSMRHGVEWTLSEVARLSPDVVIANNVVPAYYAAKWLGAAGVPVVSVLHSDDRFYLRLMESFLAEGSGHRVAAYVAVSQHLRQKAGPFGSGLPSETIACGAPMPELRAAPPADGDFGLIYVGRISKRQKRIIDVGRALCMACDSVPGVRATIIGAGSADEELKELLAAQPGGEKVDFMGRVPLEQVQQTMAGHQACVLLSDYEGIPISMMEAMGVGLVPIVTRMESGIPELVNDGETGFYVDDRTDDFVRVVGEIAGDSERWSEVSRAARAHVEERFDSERCARRWRVFLEGVVAESEPERGSFVPPERVTFPTVGADCAWADASMTRGFRKVYLGGAKLAWSIWRKVPWGLRKPLKRLFGRGW